MVNVEVEKELFNVCVANVGLPLLDYLSDYMVGDYLRTNTAGLRRFEDYVSDYTLDYRCGAANAVAGGVGLAAT